MPALRVAHVRTVEDLFDVNRLFDSNGLNSVGPAEPDQQVLALHLDDRVVGALYACAPVAVAEALVSAGVGLEDAAATAGRIQAIEALAVEGGRHDSQYASVLLEGALEFAARDFGTEVVLAKISTDDHTLVQWYMRQDFEVSRPGQALQVDGVVLPPSPEYLDAWKVISSNPKTTVGIA